MKEYPAFTLGIVFPMELTRREGFVWWEHLLGSCEVQHDSLRFQVWKWKDRLVVERLFLERRLTTRLLPRLNPGREERTSTPIRSCGLPVTSSSLWSTLRPTRSSIPLEECPASSPLTSPFSVECFWLLLPYVVGWKGYLWIELCSLDWHAIIDMVEMELCWNCSMRCFCNL